ncbi:hypothetical protein ACJ72_05397 [Emergomyces africanus]|uniref:Uncharacterized protein n=1 Tax=Emergomyces africanus TaxID=1955775 RepID=A0A1B7NU11_9EURO|nr:hypothetical protein ACJ72_05397 [Emergomyces africanus]
MDPDRYKDVGDSHVACFVPQLYAAELLAKAGYRLCIVSDFAARVYGLDNIIVADIIFAICDDQISDAAAYLLSHDFKKVPFERRGTESAEDDASIRIKHSTLEPDVGMVLSPASVWHLDLGSAHYQASITMLPSTSCPFPRFSFFLNSIIQTLADQILTTREQPRYLEYFHMQWIYSGMILLCPQDLRERLPPENQFFIKYYYKMQSHSDRTDICRLRQAVQDGEMDVATATDSLPQKAFKIVELMSKQRRPSDRFPPTPRWPTPVLISPRECW